MRELKFRAWDTNRKKMVDMDYFECHKFGFRLLRQKPTDPDAIDWSDGFEIMQFTGLKDKNGKEIYEGDIVRVVAASVASLASIQRVMWQEFRGCWAVGGDLYNNDLWKYVQNGGTCEVIGNIFKGPIEE